MKPTKTYLGDGVYVDVEGAQIVLTTEDGISVTNTIYLEPHVYQALVRFVIHQMKDVQP